MAMARTYRLVLGVGAAALVMLVVAGLAHRSSSRHALEEYKAALRAKGEKLSFAELGFPRPPESNAGLMRFQNALGQIPSRGFGPGMLAPMRFVGPGRALDCSKLPRALQTYGSAGATNWVSWEEVNGHLEDAADQLTEIRAAVEQPMRWFIDDPYNYLRRLPSPSTLPFVQMRSAAQWLSADALGALHAGQRDRALQDIHAIVQLTEFGRDDPTLVSQMIRIAISGLGLSVTWEALQDSDWQEPQLAAMRRDWERVDLLQALANGVQGERAFGDALFSQIKEQGANRTLRSLNPPRSGPSVLENLGNSVVTFAWKLNAPEDERLLFRFYQGQLEAIRMLQEQKPWPEVAGRQKVVSAELDRTIGQARGIRKFQYLFSAIAIPNLTKATQVAVRNETQRRLTIVAISLRRFELRNHHLPANLQELTPEFLAAIPIDPMSGQPLRYRLNADGTFVLYSVGEDGHDDGGDATPPKPISQFDLWSGRDAVWPLPVVESRE